MDDEVLDFGQFSASITINTNAFSSQFQSFQSQLSNLQSQLSTIAFDPGPVVVGIQKVEAAAAGLSQTIISALQSQANAVSILEKRCTSVLGECLRDRQKLVAAYLPRAEQKTASLLLFA